MPFADEQALVERVSDWQRRKYDAGFGALSWPVEGVGSIDELVPAADLVHRIVDEAAATLTKLAPAP